MVWRAEDGPCASEDERFLVDDILLAAACQQYPALTPVLMPVHTMDGHRQGLQSSEVSLQDSRNLFTESRDSSLFELLEQHDMAELSRIMTLASSQEEHRES